MSKEKRVAGTLREDHWLGPILGKRAAVWTAESCETLAGRTEDYGFVFAKVAPDRIRDISFLEDQGFHLIDTQITWVKPLGPDPAGGSSVGDFDFSFADPRDTETGAEVAALAARAFSLTRFHLDPEIAPEHANRIKGEWAGGFFRGQRGDAMIVARDRRTRKCVGFLQLLAHPPRLIVDLIAVDADFRGRGISQAMLALAPSRYPQLKEYVVGTQLANRASIQAYSKFGFRLADSAYVFHWHAGGA